MFWCTDMVIRLLKVINNVLWVRKMQVLVYVMLATGCRGVNVNKWMPTQTAAERSKERAVDRVAKKKRILLSTTTKGLVQWYLSTHLDSSSRLDPPNRSYWRAPLSPGEKGTTSAERVKSDKEGDGHLSYRVASHWAGPRQGVSLRCA